MADEETVDTSSGDELAEFAHSFAEDTPDISAGETTPAADTKPAEEVKPPAEEKPKEDAAAEEEEEDIFKLDEEKPKADKPGDEEEQEPEKPASKDDWQRLRESRNKHRAAAEEKEAILREKEAEVEELKVKAARVTELEEIAQKFVEQEKKLALLEIQETVDFQKTVEAPLVAIRSEAESLARDNDSEFGPIRDMLLEPDRSAQRQKLKELTSGWDEVDRQELKKMADDARVLLDKKDALLANAHAAAAEQKNLAAQREQEAKQAARKEFTNVTGDVVKSLREKLPFVPLLEGETEDDRYTSLQDKVSRVDFDAQTPRAKALAAASALALPQAIKTIAAKDVEIQSLKDALAKATKGKPSVTPKADVGADEETDYFKAMGIDDRRPMFGAGAD